MRMTLPTQFSYFGVFIGSRLVSIQQSRSPKAARSKGLFHSSDRGFVGFTLPSSVKL